MFKSDINWEAKAVKVNGAGSYTALKLMPLTVGDTLKVPFGSVPNGQGLIYAKQKIDLSQYSIAIVEFNELNGGIGLNFAKDINNPSTTSLMPLVENLSPAKSRKTSPAIFDVDSLSGEAYLYVGGYWSTNLSINISSVKLVKANPLVPTMTSNTTPSGKAICNSASSGKEAYKAFDKESITTLWASNSDATSGNYIGYVFDDVVSVKRVLIHTAEANINVVNIEGSNNGADWTPLKENLSIPAYSSNLYSIEMPNSYTHFRIMQVSTDIANKMGMYEVQFYR